MQVLLQPVGSSDNPHFVDTIEHPVERERIFSSLDHQNRARLAEIFAGRTSIPTWGVTPGKNGINARKWQKIQPGDIVLFSRENRIIGSAVVAAKVHSVPLAVDLWKRNNDGETWEYMYFLDELTRLHIPYEEFNLVAGYEPNNVIHGFNVLNESKSQQIATALDISTARYHPDESIEHYKNALKKRLQQAGETDQQRAATQRLEQDALRTALFGRRAFAICCVCGVEYSVDFVIAGHVKKRAHCSLEERLDFENVAAPMCKAGCDALYEQGYIAVDDDGVIQPGRRPARSIGVEALVKKVRGRSCLAFTTGSAPYFKWHREFFSGL